MPQQPGDFASWLVNGMAWLVRAIGSRCQRHELKRKRDNPAPQQEDLYIQRLMPADACASAGGTTPPTPGGTGAGDRHRRLSAWPMLYGLRDTAASPPRRAGGHRQRRSSTSTTARARTSGHGGGPEWAGRDAGWSSFWRRRQRPGFFTAGRAGGAHAPQPCADRARRAADSRALEGTGLALRRHAPDAVRWRWHQRRPCRRCGADVAGLRQPGHVATMPIAPACFVEVVRTWRGTQARTWEAGAREHAHAVPWARLDAVAVRGCSVGAAAYCPAGGRVPAAADGRVGFDQAAVGGRWRCWPLAW